MKAAQVPKNAGIGAIKNSHNGTAPASEPRRGAPRPWFALVMLATLGVFLALGTTALATVVIITPPASVTVCSPSGASFTLSATGSNLHYQWLLDSGAGPQPVGADTPSYTLTPTAPGDKGWLVSVDLIDDDNDVTTTPVTLTVNAPPTASAGAAQTICANGSSTGLGGVVGGGATGGTWTTSGSGTFTPNATTLNASYTASTADASTGTVTLTLTTTGQQLPCGAATAQVVETVNETATASAGAAQTLCSGTASASLGGTVGGGATGSTWTTSGSGTFTPNATTLNASYTPSAADASTGTATLTLTTTGQSSPCGAVTAQVVVTINPAATTSAGSNQTICGSQITAALGGAVSGGATGGLWTSSGSGSFSPNATTLNPTYTPSAADISAGAVTLTLSTTGQLAPCGPATAHVVVTIHPLATASTGGNQTICASQSTAGLGGTVGGGVTGGTWSSATGGTFAPSATTLNANYTPSAADKSAGAVTLTLTTTGQLAPCAPAATQVVVTIQALPAITGEPANKIVCAGSPAIFSVTATGLGLTYQWQVSTDNGVTFNNISATATNASYTNLAPTFADSGKYYQVVVSGTCTPSQTSTRAGLTVEQPPTVQVGAAQTVCSSSPVQLTGSFGDGATAAVWSGAGTFAPNASTLNAQYTPTAAEIAAHTATVTLTASDPTADCAPAIATTTITLNSAAQVNAGPNQSVCASSPNALLAGSYGGAATIITWSGGAGTFVPNTHGTNAAYIPTTAEVTAGTVTLTLTSDDPPGLCGKVSSSMTITYIKGATASAGANQTICSSSSTAALGGIVGGGATGGLWTSSGTGTFSPNATALNATYAPSAADAAAGTVSLTLTSTG